MVFTYTDSKTKEKYVLMSSSRNSNLKFFVKKSKINEARKNGHIFVDKPVGAKVEINKLTGHPYLKY